MIDYGEWLKQKCAEYKTEFSTYEKYASTLEEILKEICRSYAPRAIVQTRTKAFSSFAEKMARKAARYMTLGIGPTDLCGARVITETQAEVERVSAVIREEFLIDEGNSVDTRTRLKSHEFGYSATHYVVQLPATAIFGVRIPKEIEDRKAEIQVHTLLENAWANITHDRIYKANFHAPEHLRRELARVAALLEETDARFGASIRALDSYKLHYGVYMDPAQLAETVKVLEAVLENEPVKSKKPVAALRLAQVMMAIHDWGRVEQLLRPYTKLAGDYQLEVLAEHGHALCQLNSDRPVDSPFRQGQAEIEQTLEGAEGEEGAKGDLRTRALAYRAWASACIPDNEEASREHFRAAFEADTKNPFHLASHIEYELYCGEAFGLRTVTRPALLEAIGTCRAYANARIELPLAFLTMGRLYLLLGDVCESLAAYAKAIRMCLNGIGSTSKEQFERIGRIGVTDAFDVELHFLRRINRGHAMPEAHDWARRSFQLAKVADQLRHQERFQRLASGVQHAEIDAAKPIGLSAKRPGFVEPVVILAGGTSPESQPTIDTFRETVLDAFDKFRGTIISGGTAAGVAGLAGDIAAGNAGAEVLGYIPEHLPFNQPIDRRYSAHILSDGATYGAGDPLQYWTDLLLAGVPPKEVRMVGIDGGTIAGFEYRLALALGATVGLLEPVTRAAATLNQDPDWKSESNLLLLPKDAMALRAFVQQPSSVLTSEQREMAAQIIHEQFLAENRHTNPDLAMQPWADLRDDFKDSNRMQAERIAAFLERVGYRLEPADGSEAIALSTKEVDQLAEMEHGRWIIERLQSGWRYGPQRDPANKISPYLVPWNTLSDDVKEYDRNAVSSWPSVMAKAGLRIVRK